jgi:FtsP/CotA-like multicopper oxidase with cupredoxin domain
MVLERKTKIGGVAVILFIVMVLIFSGIRQKAEAAGTSAEAKSLFETKCSLCHYTKLALTKKKSEKGWASTVRRMREKYGAQVKDGEAEAIVAYLSEVASKEAAAVLMEEEPRSYMKAMSPAGFNVVIGSKNPLKEMPFELIKDEKGREVKVFKVNVVEVEFEIYPGKKVKGWGFNGQIPGPVIRVTEGDLVRVEFTNATREPHTIHFHGQTKPVEMDGVPFVSQAPVEPGEKFVYEFRMIRPGTHMYHCHLNSAMHVDMGMYGPLIVERKKEKVKFDREYVWVLDEWPDGKGPEIMYDKPNKKEREELGRDWYPELFAPYDPEYNTFLINGRAFPYTEPIDVKEGEKVLIRIINVGYEDHYIHTHSHKFKVVYMDGNPVKYPQEMDTVMISPGQRKDILLEANNPGVWPVHCHRLVHIANDKIYPGGMLTILRYIE